MYKATIFYSIKCKQLELGILQGLVKCKTLLNYLTDIKCIQY